MTHPKNVNIPDPYLAYGIRKTLDLEEGEPIPESKLQELTELYAGGPSSETRFFDDEHGISDLTGLEKATGLVQLDLNENSLINDLKPLAGLQNLKSLELSDISVGTLDVGPLAHLQNLESLYLSDTSISDVGPLAHLQNLQSLDLSDTLVEDLSPLNNHNLHNLVSLVLKGTPVEDFTPIAGLQNLRSPQPQRHFSIGRGTLRQSTELTVSRSQ